MAILCSLMVASVLALAAMIFSMQVYDRVVPANPTRRCGAVRRGDDGDPV